MVTADEILNLQNGQANEQDFKLAEVKGLFETGTAKIQFYGETEPSEKEYSYLSTYKPTIDDIVLVIPFAETYIIAGKIVYQIVIEDNTVTQSQLEAALQNYVLTTALATYVTQTYLSTQLSGYAQTSHKHDEIYYSSYGAGFSYILNNVPQFVPTSSNIGLGASNYKWKEVYAVTSPVTTSDLKLKNSVQPIPQKYKDLFMLLNPIIYKMNDGESGRFHAGFGAQHVEKAMKKLKMDSKDFAGFIKSPAYNKEGKQVKGEYEYGLRYSEFIALNTLMTQDNTKKIEEQENIINQQQIIINDLIKRIEKLEAREGE